MSQVRGKKIGMIPADPMMSLDPVFDHRGADRRRRWSAHTGRGGDSPDAAGDRSSCCAVQIPEPERRIKQWPHEMSGGMRQRIVGIDRP